jgi:hypothetical protein
VDRCHLVGVEADDVAVCGRRAGCRIPQLPSGVLRRAAAAAWRRRCDGRPRLRERRGADARSFAVSDASPALEARKTDSCGSTSQVSSNSTNNGESDSVEASSLRCSQPGTKIPRYRCLQPRSGLVHHLRYHAALLLRLPAKREGTAFERPSSWPPHDCCSLS